MRRGNTLDGRENSIGEEDEDGLENENGLEDEDEDRLEDEDVKSNGKGVRGVSDEKGVDILKKRAPSHNISKSCSPPRFIFSHLQIFFLRCKISYFNIFPWQSCTKNMKSVQIPLLPTKFLPSPFNTGFLKKYLLFL